MPNVLPFEKRLRVLAGLVDGNSERGVERMTGASLKTIRRFALQCGAGARPGARFVAREGSRFGSSPTTPGRLDPQWKLARWMIVLSNLRRVNAANMRHPASDNFEVLWQCILDDARAALERARREPVQMHRREAVRAVFAFVEGLTFLLKEQVLARFPGSRDEYTDAEVAMLRDEQYSLNSKGQACSQTKFTPTDQALRFGMAMYMRGTNAESEFDVARAEWNALVNGLKVRHRVTHPKKAQDFEVTDAEMHSLEVAFLWLVRVVTRNMANATIALCEEVRRLRSQTGPASSTDPSA